MLIYYLLIGMIAGALTNITRPKEYDDVATYYKAAVPIISGVFWPLMALYFIYNFIRRR